jgi:hypothetical protein
MANAKESATKIRDVAFTSVSPIAFMLPKDPFSRHTNAVTEL